MKTKMSKTTDAQTKKTALVPVPVAESGFDQQLRTLTKLREDSVTTEVDFGRKKKQILGL
jgi:serine protease inhibitor ecotin